MSNENTSDCAFGACKLGREFILDRTNLGGQVRHFVKVSSSFAREVLKKDKRKEYGDYLVFLPHEIVKLW